MTEDNINTRDTFIFGKYQIHYTVRNGGARSKIGILLLHGRYTHSGYWSQLFGDQDRYTVFAYDSPGQGRSSGSRGRFDLFRLGPELYADFIANIISRYDIDSLYVLGESAGSLVAFYGSMEKKIPRDICGLIFMPGVYRVPQLERVMDRTVLSLLSFFVPWLRLRGKKPLTAYTENERLLGMLRNDKYFSRLSSVRYIHGIYRFVKYLNRRIEECSIPLLMLHGRYDSYSEPSCVTRFFNRIPDTTPKKIVLFDNSKHWLLGSDDIDEVRSSLFNWIEEREDSVL